MNRKYFQEHIDFIRENISGRSHKELTDMFNKYFNTAVPVQTISSLASKYNLKKRNKP